MSRKRIEQIIKGYADRVGYNFGTEVIPYSLGGGTKYPYILWIAPNSTTNGKKRITKYPSTICLVADADKRDATEVLDELQEHAQNIFDELQKDRVFTDGSFPCNPKTALDNSGAHGIDVVINIYYDGGC